MDKKPKPVGEVYGSSEWKDRMKRDVPPSVESLLFSDEPITEEKWEDAKKSAKYQNRDKMPEPYLPYADLYNELTGQEPTKRVIQDWMFTFNEWQAEGLTEESIRAAWEQANRPDGGFTVGRPGSLTVTAVGMKSKAKAPQPQVDQVAVEATKAYADEVWEHKKFVPPPDGTRDRIKAAIARSKHATETD